MNETIFSVDVETTSTSTATGNLISIGAVAIESDGHGSLRDIGEFYVRINNPDIINFEDAEFPAWDNDTLAWWQTQEQQSPEAYAEVFDHSLVRHHPETAAKMLVEFVEAKGGTDASACVFAANPASFDWPWIDRLLATWRIPSPFSHRTLCLRSAVYGSDINLGVAQRIRTNRPIRPHHALDDAKAQADDLREFWIQRYGPKCQDSAT